MSRLLQVHEYNKEWALEFTKIKTFLDSILTSLIDDIIHVGSTSVVSLAAKPIIDIDIVYSDNLNQIIRVLEANDYMYEGEKGIPNRHSFRRLKDDFHYHHLYAIKEGDTELTKHLSFKRALQMSPQARKQYADLKFKLVKANNKDRELYTNSKTELILSILKEETEMKSIVLAGGCFWGVEAYFKMIPGVVDTEVGYINGDGTTTYKEVCAGSGHAEAVLIKYDDDKVSLKKILDHLFNIIDPTSINKQGNDVGIQYRSGIYNYTPDQLPFIKNYIAVRQKEFNRPIALELATDLVFYPAEDYHQDYLEKNKNGYCHVDLHSHNNVE